MVAGLGVGQSVTSAEIYAGSFSPTGSLATPREFHTATLLADGTVLVVGGLNRNDGTGALMTAEIYIPTTRTWR
jgi:hypothetical protein